MTSAGMCLSVDISLPAFIHYSCILNPSLPYSVFRRTGCTQSDSCFTFWTNSYSNTFISFPYFRYIFAFSFIYLRFRTFSSIEFVFNFSPYRISYSGFCACFDCIVPTNLVHCVVT